MSQSEVERLSTVYDYQAVFGNDAGQRVLEDIIQHTHYYDPLYYDGMQPMDLAWREGQRSVALWLLETVTEALTNPDAVHEYDTSGLPQENEHETP